MAPFRRLGLGLALIMLIVATVGAVRFWLRADPARLLAQAQADFQAGRYKQAEALLKQLEAIRDPTPMDRMARAQIAWGQERGSEALSELSRIPDDSTLAPLAHLLAGRIEVKRGHVRAALAHFQASLDREPDLVQAHRELAYLYNVQHRQADLDREMEALSELNALSLPYLIHWGKTRNVAWNPTDDCKELARFVAADPDDRDSRLALVDGLIRLGQDDRAEAALAPLPDSDPEARARRVQLALRRGERDLARALLADGPADHPDLARFRGELALRDGQPKEAVRHLRLAQSARPDDRAILSLLATALRLSGDPDAAKPYMEAVRRHDALTPLISHASIEEWQKEPKMALRLAQACESAGRFPEARAWYRLAISRDPLDSQAQQGLFRCREAESAAPGSLPAAETAALRENEPASDRR